MDKFDRANENLLSLIHDLASRAETFRSWPSWIEFSTNNRCNLKCVMCTQSDIRLNDVMPREVASRLLDAVLPEASLLTPSAGSEPLLGDLDLMVEKCREHDVHLSLITNGTLLTEKRFREIADRIQKLQFSFDSHIPEIYEGIRKNAKFLKTQENIRGVLKVSAELKIPVVFVMVLMADNAEHIPDYVDFIADQGGDQAHAEIRIQRLIDLSSRYTEHRVENRYTTDQLLKIFEETAKRAQKRGIIIYSDLDPPLRGELGPVAPFVRGVSGDVLTKHLPYIKKHYPHYCYMASYYLKVIPTGQVYPCCRGPEELIMGNLLETPFEDIWNGDAFRAFRRKMHNRNYPRCCRSCDVLIGNPHFTKDP